MSSNDRPTTNPHLLGWVDEMAKLCKPDRVVWCDGSEAEKKQLTEEAVAQKVLIPLDQKKWPGLLLPPLEPERRRPRRAPHLHLHADEGGGRPDQQLDGAGGGVPEALRASSTAR